MKSLTELVIILDKSGSMHGLEKDVVGGFNSLIESQKKLEGDTLVTTILFDDHKKVVHSRVDINEINNLQEKDYNPSGCTALLDTIGYAITTLKNIHSNMKSESVPEHVIFSIMTDGLENSSLEYTRSMIKNLIEEQKAKGWDFIFQAANIDSVGEGTSIGISKEDIASFDANTEGVKMCFCCVTDSVMKKRAQKKELRKR